MLPTTLADWIALVLSGSALTAGTWRYVLAPLRRGARRILAALERVDSIWIEVMPNGGRSLRDSVTRLEQQQTIQTQILRAVAAAMPIGTWQSDAAGAITEVNRNTQRICRRTADELLGHAWVSWVHDDDRPEFVAAWSAAVADRRAFDGRCRLLLPDGRLQRVRSRADAILDARGTYIGHFGTLEPLGYAYGPDAQPPAHNHDPDDTGAFRVVAPRP